MKHLVATAPESFNAQSEPLPRTDWTATASDASPGYPVNNILDGNPGTIWHSRFEGTPAPLPHTVTIDMKAARDISGLRYLPRQDGNPNGRIGQFSVATSLDGVVYSDPASTGTWADTADEKTIAFQPLSARYVRLTARSRGWQPRAVVVSRRDRRIARPGRPSRTAADRLDRDGRRRIARIPGGQRAGRERRHDLALAVRGHTGAAAALDHGRHAGGAGRLRAAVPAAAGRQPNGTIGQYSVTVSRDGATFSAPVVTGTWADNTLEKAALFPPCRPATSG